MKAVSGKSIACVLLAALCTSQVFAEDLVDIYNLAGRGDGGRGEH